MKLYFKNFCKKCLKLEEDTFQTLIEMESYSEVKIHDMQNDKLLEIFSIAYNTTSYYKRIFDSLNIDYKNVSSLKKIPFLTKDIIKTYKKDLINSTIKKKNLNSRQTGGSTGEPLQLISDKLSSFIDNAHHTYLFHIMNYKKGDILISGFGVKISNSDIENNIYWNKTEKEDYWGDFVFSALYLNKETIPYFIEKIISLRPNILRGLPSFFYILANYIFENKIEIDFNVKGIVLTSEVCSIEQRLKIEEVFSTTVYFEYGHREISVFAYTVDHTYIYKSSAIYGYVEVLDDKGNDVAVGEIGKIVVTGFLNKGMPMIRYDTGDLGKVKSRNFGQVDFFSIEGREQDYIINSDNSKIYLTTLLPHLVYKSNVFRNVQLWQIIQNKVGEIILIIDKKKLFTDTDDQNIRKLFKKLFSIEVKCKYKDEIAITTTGKHLFIIQNIAVKNDI